MPRQLDLLLVVQAVAGLTPMPAPAIDCRDPSARYMLAVCERERRQRAPRDTAAPTAEGVAETMEGAGRRHARPRFRGVVGQCADRVRVEL